MFSLSRSTPRAADPTDLGRFAVLIDIAFYALILTAAVRFLSSHGLSQRWWLVCVLSLALALSYAGTRFLPDRSRLWGPAIIVALWLSLTAVAPSFWWCAFSLFFVCRQRLGKAAAILSLVVIAVMTGWALSTLAGGVEWTTLVGIAVVAILLESAFGQMEKSESRVQGTLRSLLEAQEREAAAEHRAGQVEERERISRELHDTVTQGLTSSLLMMEAAAHTWTASPEQAQQSLAIATASVRTNLAETRNMVHQLASPRLEGSSVDEALEVLAAEIPGGSFITEGEPAILSDELTHGILRITQSALENVRRHAQAERVHVTLTYLPTRVHLDIVDNGVGFEAATLGQPTIEGGYGLRAMQQRTVALGGSLTIEGAPGAGTIIAAQFPLSSGEEGSS